MKFECPFIDCIDLSLDVWKPLLQLDMHLREDFEARIQVYKKKNDVVELFIWNSRENKARKCVHKCVVF